MKTAEYLITKLAEEAAEVTQRCTKILTFGLHEVQPGQTLTNSQRLEGELADLVAVWEMLQGIQVLTGGPPNRGAITAKKDKVRLFMEYSMGKGVLEADSNYRNKDLGTGRTTKMIQEAAEAIDLGENVIIVMASEQMIQYATTLLDRIASPITECVKLLIELNIHEYANGKTIKFLTPFDHSIIRDGKVYIPGFNGLILVDHAVRRED